MMNLQSQSFRSELFKLALPISLQAILTSSLSLIDVFMVSFLGSTEVGAVGLINKLYFVVILTITGLVSGAAILASQSWGAKQYEKVGQYLSSALVYALLLTSAISVIAFFLPTEFMQLISNDESVIQVGAEYLYFTALFAVMTGASLTLASIIRATGKTTEPMLASALAILVNTFLNYCLIFGNFGFSEMGIKGAAYATVISRALELLLLSIVLFRHKQLSLRKPDSELAKGVWLQSYPLILNELLWSSGLFAYHVIYSYMGKDELAAMSMLAPIEGIMIDIFVGFSVASSIMLGHRLGRAEFDEAYKVSQFFLTRFPIIGVFVGVLMALSADSILSLYSQTGDNVRHMATTVLYVLAATLWLKIHNMIACAGVLRSGGDTKFVLFVDIGTIWLIGVPMAFIAGVYWQFPLYLVVVLLLSEELVKLFLWIHRVRSKKWLRSLV